MNTVEELASCLDLVAKDLCEAHAADRMQSGMAMRDGRLADFNCSEARFGLRFIEHSLELRMMQAVNRTLDRPSRPQGRSDDKANFARLLKLARAAPCNGDLSGFEERLDQLRNGEAARKLRECRNGFMAHTLFGEFGSRGGMRSNLVADLLDQLTNLYEDIHHAVTGTRNRSISEDLEKWRTRAQETWDILLGIADADEDLVA